MNEPRSSAASRKATRITLLAVAVPLLLALVVVNVTWLNVSLVEGVTTESQLQATGAQGTVFLALLLASAALAVVFFIVGKAIRYVLAVVQLSFSVFIVLATWNFIADPINVIRPDLESLTGLTGQHAFDNIIQSYSLTIWPYFMYGIAALMAFSAFVMVRQIRLMPEATHKYDRAEKPSHQDNWGIDEEFSVDDDAMEEEGGPVADEPKED